MQAIHAPPCLPHEEEVCPDKDRHDELLDRAMTPAPLRSDAAVAVRSRPGDQALAAVRVDIRPAAVRSGSHRVFDLVLAWNTGSAYVVSTESADGQALMLAIKATRGLSLPLDGALADPKGHYAIGMIIGGRWQPPSTARLGAVVDFAMFPSDRRKRPQLGYLCNRPMPRLLAGGAARCMIHFRRDTAAKAPIGADTGGRGRY